MTMPNFLVIGAAKAGTTSLYSYLAQHPEIFMSAQKEPRFFALEGETPTYRGATQAINRTSITQLEDYQKLFSDVSQETAIGEASTVYLYSEKAAERIAHHISDVKLIAVLRNPVDRAFSSYVHLVRDGFEKLSFEDGLAAESQRLAENWQPLWFYQDRGFYASQLKPYFDRFEPHQIRVYLYDELAGSPRETVQDMYRFLGVSDTFEPNWTRSNISGVPKRAWVRDLFTRDNALKSAIKPLLPKSMRSSISKGVQRRNVGKKPILQPETRSHLQAIFKDDILQLETLIGRDLSAWLA